MGAKQTSKVFGQKVRRQQRLGVFQSQQGQPFTGGSEGRAMGERLMTETVTHQTQVRQLPEALSPMQLIEWSSLIHNCNPSIWDVES